MLSKTRNNDLLQDMGGVVFVFPRKKIFKSDFPLTLLRKKLVKKIIEDANVL